MIRGTEKTDRLLEHRGIAAWAPWRRWALGLGVLGVAVAFAWPAVARWTSAERSVERGRLRLAPVELGDLERDVTVEGRVVAAFHPTLFSPAPGMVSLGAQPGDVVEAGVVLARISSPELESRLGQERSGEQAMAAALERQELLTTQNGLENAQAVDLLSVRAGAAERAMGRARRNHEAGLVNDIELEKAQDDLEIARLELENARRKIELDRERLDLESRHQELQLERQRLLVADLERQVRELEIRAPVGGRVAHVDVKDREAVVAGQAILTVVDLSALEVEIDVPESYADEVTIGTPVEVMVGGKAFAGEVRRIAPEVEAHLVHGRVAFTAEKPPELKQNQRLSTRIVLDARRGVLKVKRGPFLDAGGGHFAYFVEGDLATRRKITTGAVSAAEVEIEAGAVAGEILILSDLSRFAGAETLLVRD